MTERELQDQIGDLQDALVQAQAAYHQAAATESMTQLAVRAGAIKDLRQKLAAVLGIGANVCPLCGSKPLAIRKRGEIKGNDPQPPLFEVGCTVCPARARHWSRLGAVAKWNMGDLLVEPRAEVVATP